MLTGPRPGSAKSQSAHAPLAGTSWYRRAGDSGVLLRMATREGFKSRVRDSRGARAIDRPGQGVTLLLVKQVKEERAMRFSISVPPTLARQLDQMARQKGYDNRSLAVADMIRAHLLEHRQSFGDEDIAGTITLLYDHHKQHVQAALTDIQHDHQAVIIATLHVHLDHRNCMEVLAVRGQAALIKRIADELIAAKGVKHGKLTVTSTGKDLPG